MTSKRCGATCVALAFLATGIVACSVTIAPVVGSFDAGAAAPDASFAGQDGAPLVDSSVIAPGPDTATTCAPGNVKGYIPQWTPPRTPKFACTAAEIGSYGECLDDSTSSACASHASAACKTCLADSKSTDPSWGPLVDVGSSGSDRQLNVAGCMAILLHDTGSGCAGSVQALQECEAAACADNCEGALSVSLNACTQEADGAGCGNYVGPAACISDAGAGIETCFAGASASFGDQFVAVATVFCLQTDGG